MHITKEKLLLLFNRRQTTAVVGQPSQPPQPASVVMETASSFDITHMTLEELSCRRMREEEEEDEDGDGEDDEGGEEGRWSRKLWRDGIILW